MKSRVFTVAQVNRYIKRLFEDDALLNGVAVEGELSNVKIHTSGHIYFTLKDENAAVGGVMFRSNTERLPFSPKNGMRAVVFGYISLYEKTGQYQLYAEHIEPAGVGGLQTAFDQLCDKLRKEGLFDVARKRPLPAYVSCVAVVTSPTGAAVRDIIRVIQTRNPAVKIIIAPALVQGEGAAQDIARAIAEVNEWGAADVIIVGRGGGSAEDLWAFNEEVTARAVVGSKIPVISAVGHETDFTVTDFAADFRAPTPTAAASSAVFDRDEVLEQLRALTRMLGRYAREIAENRQNELRRLKRCRFLQRPLEPVYQRQLHLQGLVKSLGRLTADRLARDRSTLDNRFALLERVSPHAVWKRGYAAVRRETGDAVVSVNMLRTGDVLGLRFADGNVETSVTRIQSNV